MDVLLFVGEISLTPKEIRLLDKINRGEIGGMVIVIVIMCGCMIVILMMMVLSA